MSSVKEDTIHSMKWSTIERFIVQGAYFVIGIIMARQLNPSDYGTVGVLGIFLGVSQTFIDSGFGNALIRKLDRTEVDFSTVFYFNLAVSIICYLVLFISAPYIASFFEITILCPIVRVQSLTLVFGALMGIHMTKLLIDLNFKAIAQRTILATIISGAVGIVCAYSGLGVWSLVIQNLTNVLTSVIFILLYVRWKPLLVFSKKSFCELFSFGSKLLASGLINTLFGNLNTLVIGKFFSAKDLGYYSRGTNFAQMPVSTINSILGKITYPIFSKIQNDNERLISVYRKYVCIMSIPIFFGCCLLASIGKPLILFLLTDKWSESIIYLQIFVFCIMFDHIQSINLNLLIVKGRSDLFLKLEIIKKTISIIILFASIPFGVLGICVSKILYSQIALAINTYYTGKLFNLGYLKQWGDFSIYFIISIICCIPGFIISQYVPIHPILSLCIGLTLGSILYYLMLRNNPFMKEILSTVKSGIKTFLH